MAGPFKMKGFSGFGNSPMKKPEKIKIVDARSKTRKIWDKATQVGMGGLGFAKELLGTKAYKGDISKGYGRKDPWYEAKKAYQKEKSHDWAKGLKEKVIK